MKCTIWTTVIFVCLSVIYGTVFAANSQGLKYFSVGLYQTLRMLSGAIANLAIMGCRCIFQKGYSKVVAENFDCSLGSFTHLWIGGSFNLGIPHSILTMAQAYLPSAAMQMAQPLTSVAGSLFSLCVLPDEPMDKLKIISTVCTVVGSVIAEITPFNHPLSGASMGEMFLGLGLCVSGCAMFGMAPVYLKWKAKGFDITVSSFVQTVASTAFCFIYTLLTDGKDEMISQLKSATLMGWVWPILVGILAGSVALHGFIYLIDTVGTTGANLTSVGKLLVGVSVGVIILKEWASYKWWEICVNIIALIFLIAAIGLAFYNPKKKVDANLEKPVNPDDDIEEEKNSLEAHRKIPEEL